MNKLWLYGGAALVVVAGGAFALTRKPASATDANGSYYPATVYGQGVPTADPGGLGGTTGLSTDNSIGQLIAANIATATLQSNTTIHTSDNALAAALATVQANKDIAFDDNATVIKKSLADQIGSVISAFTTRTTSSQGGNAGFFGIGASGGSSSSVEQGPGSIVGKIGYNNGMISIDVAQGPKLTSAPPLSVLT